MNGLTVNNAQTIEDLKKLAEIDPVLAKEIKQKDCKSIFKSIQSVMGIAEEALKKKDKSTAYIYYMRTGILCAIIHKSPNRDAFFKTLEGKKFRELFKTTIENVDILNTELKNYFNDQQLANSLAELPDNLPDQCVISKPAPPRPISPVKEPEAGFDEVITPKQLMDFAKKGNRVLIIDYRDKTDVQINFKDNRDGDNVTVALCPPGFIENNITLAHLSKVLPIKERQKVDKNEMQKYDLVVFMDGDNPKKDGSNEMLPPANYLMKGLTTYAYNNRLKRPPVFLKGGFKMWSYSYPTYTNQEFHRSLFSEDDEFGRMLNEFKRDFDVMSYPDLSKPRAPEPPWPSSAGENQQQLSNGNDVKWRNVPIKVETPTVPSDPPMIPSPYPNMPAQPPSNNQTLSKPVPPRPSASETAFSPYSDAPPVSRPVVPARSLKPVAPARTTVPNDPPMTAPSPSPTPIKSVPKNIPAVGTLGGARVAEPSQHTKQSQYPNGYSRNEQAPLGFEAHSTPTSSQQQKPSSVATIPPRPPTPERPAKISGITQGETEKLLNLYSVAFKQLERTAQHGRQQPGVGFRNMGNTCFMNTTLQAIINTPKIREIFTRDVFIKYVNVKNKSGTHGTISAVFSSLVDLYFSGRVSAITPDIFLTTFANEVNSQLADRRQHDAQEFQIYLMDALHEDTNRVLVRKSYEQNFNGRNMAAHARDYDMMLSKFASSPVADLFNFRTVSVITCTVCQNSSATFEDQAQISLELEDNTFARLDDCIRRHFKIELLTNDSRWSCPNCKRPQIAQKSTNIWRMPKTLIIHFKRFTQSGSHYVKNDTNVHFDIDALRLDQYLHPEAPQQRSMFSLYAVTNHSGTLNSGHYTSYVRNQHRWLKFDDDFVSEISREALQSNKAFVLFYTSSG